MATASDQPPTSKRSDTKSPFAVLSPDAVRKQTGTRVKISEREDEQARSDELANAQAGSTSQASAEPTAKLDPSIPPESLRKPFASLTPQKLANPTADMPKVSAPPPPPSQLFRETASLRPAVAPQAARTTTSRRPDSGSVARYGTCKIHGTALTSKGACVLCAREEERRQVKRAQRIVLLFATLALIVALGVVYYAVPH